MAIAAIESALDLAIMFNEQELIAVYREALAEAGVNYQSSAKSWNE